MKVRRIAGFAGLALVGALTLSACGSDDNSGSGGGGSSAPVDFECGTASTVNAEGSSAQKNAIEEAISSYGELCPDVTVNYNPTGSGAGIKQFTAGQVDFAGSDSALNADKGEVAAAAERCEANDAWNLPMVTGPIAVAYNLPSAPSLVLDADTIAKIFHGDITTWNDPAIAALNPDAELPAQAISVFFRSDESGTTENFTKYLSATAAGVWTDEPAKQWPGSAVGEGREKSSGVAEGVKGLEGSITYVEWSYAKDNDLGVASIDTGSGPVELTADSASKAVAAAERDGEGNDLRLTLDYGTQAEGAYPIILVTYEIVCSKGLDADQASTIRSFLGHFASAEVQESLVDLGYAPLPDSVATDVRTAIDALA